MALCVFAGFLLYVTAAITATVLLIFVVAPVHGTSNICVYVAICSVVGSLSVVSCKVMHGEAVTCCSHFSPC